MRLSQKWTISPDVAYSCQRCFRLTGVTLNPTPPTKIRHLRCSLLVNVSSPSQSIASLCLLLQTWISGDVVCTFTFNKMMEQ